MITVSDQIISVIDALCTKFGIAIDWTSKNVMPVLENLAEKYIGWEIATSKMWFILGAAIFLIGLVLGCIIIRADLKDKFTDYGGGIIAGSFIIGAALIIGIPVMICQVLDIIKCIKFPELQIVEYIEELIRFSSSR